MGYYKCCIIFQNASQVHWIIFIKIVILVANWHMKTFRSDWYILPIDTLLLDIEVSKI